jgi:putative FmdB family regulatory protein
MPIYAYRCGACGHAKDVLRKVSDPLLTTCPACGAEAFTKQVTAAGFQLKGSGWYVTDFRGDAKGGKAEPGKEDSAKAESGKGEGAKGDSGGADSNSAAAGKAESGKSAAATPAASPAPTPAATPAAPAPSAGGQ